MALERIPVLAVWRTMDEADRGRERVQPTTFGMAIIYSLRLATSSHASGTRTKKKQKTEKAHRGMVRFNGDVPPSSAGAIRGALNGVFATDTFQQRVEIQVIPSARKLEPTRPERYGSLVF